MATATLLPSGNLENKMILVATSVISNFNNNWTKSFSAADLIDCINEGETDNDSDDIGIAAGVNSGDAVFGTTAATMAANQFGSIGWIRGRYKQTGWVNDTLVMQWYCRQADTTTLMQAADTTVRPTSYTNFESNIGNVIGIWDQTFLDGLDLRVTYSISSSMGADSVTINNSNFWAAIGYGYVPLQWGLTLTPWSQSTNYSNLRTDDASVVAVLLDGGEDSIHGWALDDTPADFNDMTAVTTTLRAWYTSSATPSITCRIMETHDAGTVLAAANAGGSYPTAQNLTTSEAPYTFNFAYVNTGATKTQWDNAVIEIKATGSAAYTLRVDLASTAITYNTSGPTASFIIPRKDRLMGTYLQL